MAMNVYQMVDQIRDDIHEEIDKNNVSILRDHERGYLTQAYFDRGVRAGLEIALNIINYRVERHRFEDDIQILMDILMRGGSADEKE